MLHQISPHIFVVKNSVLDVEADAIVNAANCSLLGGGGVDGAIHKAAGQDLYRCCARLHGCQTGKAKVTPSFNLKNCEYIIHAVGPVYSGKDSDDVLLSSCYNNCLNLAKEYNLSSIAFSCISTGVYGFPLNRACQIAFSTSKEWLDINRYLIDIIFCCYRDIEFEEFIKLV